MIRNTSQRKAILAVLEKTRAHPIADQIYDQVRKTMPSISKGTVYRNLGILNRQGLISELNLNGTISRYEIRQKDHYHFRCQECGKVMDIDIPVNRTLDKAVSRKTGLKVSGHQLEFRGTCLECQGKKQKAGDN
jgi:Fur family transcriptional regulator, peroxide stress response regulator